ncbi:hypothetical protein P692DRAFT_20879695 [Suillus brevipes Sb2]|nr:hypothetical protein P692DRAFT_20879695 [Suillus brevipes Sb2]
MTRISRLMRAPVDLLGHYLHQIVSPLNETLWGCCGASVQGTGDMGPLDGWCYEGRHTTDTKRARFRADSTILDDKLVSCAPRDTSPETYSSGEETAGEEHFEVSEEWNWVNGMVPDDDTEWVDEGEDEKDDLLD